MNPQERPSGSDGCWWSRWPDFLTLGDSLWSCPHPEHRTHQCLGCWFPPFLCLISFLCLVFPWVIFLMNHLLHVIQGCFWEELKPRMHIIISISHVQGRKSLAKVTQVVSGTARAESDLGPASLFLATV